LEGEAAEGYRRTNNLCHFYGDKFEPRHLQKCPKRIKL
jgi:hypothetical protein